MMECAFLMFLVPDLRALAKQGELEGDSETIQRLIDLPCSAYEAYSIYEQNFEKISKAIDSEERSEMYLSAIRARAFAREQVEERQDMLEDGSLVVFDDEKSEEELVYGVGVNHRYKFVVVAFRGSVSHQDFIQDAKIFVSTVPNPVEDLEEVGDRIGVHLGFQEYLFGRDGTTGLQSGTEVSDEKRDINVATSSPAKKRKADIITDTVAEIFQEHPDYRLYVTGHSLGGALSCLFTFSAAVAPDDVIPKPVTCITTGAPKVSSG